MVCPSCGHYLILPREIRDKLCICCKALNNATDSKDDFVEDVGSFEEIKPTHDTVKSIVIPPRIYSEMKTYCDLAKGEISGLGKIEVKDGVARIVAIALLEQENTSAHTEISEDTITKFIMNLAKKGQSPEMWKVWWHTHHDFGTFWSQVDTDNIASLSAYMQSYLISVELNKAGSVISRLDEAGKEYDVELCMEKFKGYKKLSDKCSKKIKKLTKNAPIPVIYYRGTYA